MGVIALAGVLASLATALLIAHRDEARTRRDAGANRRLVNNTRL